MRKSLCTILLTAVAIGAAAAQTKPGETSTAASRARGYDPYLTWATVWGDREGRGVYTCEEWKRYVAKLFDQADRNRHESNRQRHARAPKNPAQEIPPEVVRAQRMAGAERPEVRVIRMDGERIVR